MYMYVGQSVQNAPCSYHFCIKMMMRTYMYWDESAGTPAARNVAQGYVTYKMQLWTPRITFLAAGVPALLGRADHDELIHFLHRVQEHGAFDTDRPHSIMGQ